MSLKCRLVFLGLFSIIFFQQAFCMEVEGSVFSNQTNNKSNFEWPFAQVKGDQSKLFPSLFNEVPIKFRLGNECENECEKDWEGDVIMKDVETPLMKNFMELICKLSKAKKDRDKETWENGIKILINNISRIDEANLARWFYSRLEQYNLTEIWPFLMQGR